MRQPVAGHRIRLRGPWKISRGAGDTKSFHAEEILKHPEDWQRFSAAGRIRMTRVFHAPTNIDETESMFVLLTGVYGEGHVELNGQHIGLFTTEHSEWEFAIPNTLPFSNELAITVSFPPPSLAHSQVGIYDVIALDIRSSDDSSVSDQRSADS